MVKKIINYLFIVSFFYFLSCPLVNARENITLVSQIDGVTNIVNNTYEYKITPVNDYGVDGEPKTAIVKFNSMPNNNMATSSIDIDFKSVSYNKLGIYEYIVTEVSSSDNKTFPLLNNKYKIIVEVAEDSNKNVRKNVIQQVIDIDSGKKTELCFRHKANYTNISVKNDMLLVNPDKDKYIKYKVSIYGKIGDIYDIIGQDDLVFYEGKWIKTINKYVVKEKNNFVYVYLKKDQTVLIGWLSGLSQIEVGTKYTISLVRPFDWNEIISSNDFSEKKYVVSDGKNNIAKEEKFRFVIQGLFIDIIPFLILVCLCIIGVIIIYGFNRKNDDYDK